MASGILPTAIHVGGRPVHISWMFNDDGSVDASIIEYPSLSRHYDPHDPNLPYASDLSSYAEFSSIPNIMEGTSTSLVTRIVESVIPSSGRNKQTADQGTSLINEDTGMLRQSFIWSEVSQPTYTTTPLQPAGYDEDTGLTFTAGSNAQEIILQVHDASGRDFVAVPLSGARIHNVQKAISVVMGHTRYVLLLDNSRNIYWYNVETNEYDVFNDAAGNDLQNFINALRSTNMALVKVWQQKSNENGVKRDFLRFVMNDGSIFDIDIVENNGHLNSQRVTRYNVASFADIGSPVPGTFTGIARLSTDVFAMTIGTIVYIVRMELSTSGVTWTEISREVYSAGDDIHGIERYDYNHIAVHSTSGTHMYEYNPLFDHVSAEVNPSDASQVRVYVDNSGNREQIVTGFIQSVDPALITLSNVEVTPSGVFVTVGAPAHVSFDNPPTFTGLSNVHDAILISGDDSDKTVSRTLQYFIPLTTSQLASFDFTHVSFDFSTETGYLFEGTQMTQSHTADVPNNQIINHLETLTQVGAMTAIMALIDASLQTTGVQTVISGTDIEIPFVLSELSSLPQIITIGAGNSSVDYHVKWSFADVPGELDWYIAEDPSINGKVVETTGAGLQQSTISRIMELFNLDSGSQVDQSSQSRDTADAYLETMTTTGGTLQETVLFEEISNTNAPAVVGDSFGNTRTTFNYGGMDLVISSEQSSPVIEFSLESDSNYGLELASTISTDLASDDFTVVHVSKDIFAIAHNDVIDFVQINLAGTTPSVQIVKTITEATFDASDITFIAMQEGKLMVTTSTGVFKSSEVVDGQTIPGATVLTKLSGLSTITDIHSVVPIDHDVYLVYHGVGSDAKITAINIDSPTSRTLELQDGISYVQGSSLRRTVDPYTFEIVASDGTTVLHTYSAALHTIVGYIDTGSISTTMSVTNDNHVTVDWHMSSVTKESERTFAQAVARPTGFLSTVSHLPSNGSDTDGEMVITIPGFDPTTMEASFAQDSKVAGASTPLTIIADPSNTDPTVFRVGGIASDASKGNVVVTVTTKDGFVFAPEATSVDRFSTEESFAAPTSVSQASSDALLAALTTGSYTRDQVERGDVQSTVTVTSNGIHLTFDFAYRIEQDPNGDEYIYADAIGIDAHARFQLARSHNREDHASFIDDLKERMAKLHEGEILTQDEYLAYTTDSLFEVLQHSAVFTQPQTGSLEVYDVQYISDDSTDNDGVFYFATNAGLYRVELSGGDDLSFTALKVNLNSNDNVIALHKTFVNGQQSLEVLTLDNSLVTLWHIDDAMGNAPTAVLVNGGPSVNMGQEVKSISGTNQPLIDSSMGTLKEYFLTFNGNDEAVMVIGSVNGGVQVDATADANASAEAWLQDVDGNLFYASSRSGATGIYQFNSTTSTFTKITSSTYAGFDHITSMASYGDKILLTTNSGLFVWDGSSYSKIDVPSYTNEGQNVPIYVYQDYTSTTSVSGHTYTGNHFLVVFEDGTMQRVTLQPEGLTISGSSTTPGDVVAQLRNILNQQ